MPQIKKNYCFIDISSNKSALQKTVNVEILLAEYKQQSSKQSTLYSLAAQPRLTYPQARSLGHQ